MTELGATSNANADVPAVMANPETVSSAQVPEAKAAEDWLSSLTSAQPTSEEPGAEQPPTGKLPDWMTDLAPAADTNAAPAAQSESPAVEANASAETQSGEVSLEEDWLRSFE